MSNKNNKPITNIVLGAAVASITPQKTVQKNVPVNFTIQDIIKTLKKIKVPKGATVSMLHLTSQGWGNGWNNNPGKKFINVKVFDKDGWEKDIQVEL